MNENLGWFNRVYDALQEEDSYNVNDMELMVLEGLEDYLVFRKQIGYKHPIIELYETEDEERIFHICFDPSNQQFYHPVVDDIADKKLHLLLDSFEEIKDLFVRYYSRYVENKIGIELEEEEEDEGVIDEFLFERVMELNNLDDEDRKVLYHHLSTLKMLQQQEENEQEKMQNIEWLEEEEIISSMKLDIPIPFETQTVLRLGVISETNDRVLCKETRFLINEKVTTGSSQVFLINQEELAPLIKMVQKHFMNE